jgi:integrase
MLKTEFRKRYLQATDKQSLIFQSREGTPLNPSNVYKRLFRPAVEAAKIGKLKMHDLRHTFGSWKIEQGENVLYVSKQMGHKDASITLKVYSHLVKESRPEAAAKTDALAPGSSDRTGYGSRGDRELTGF